MKFQSVLCCAFLLCVVIPHRGGAQTLTTLANFTGTNGGAFSAHPGFDQTTGLGTPNATPLAGALCAATLSLVNPGTLSLTQRARVATRLRANDARGVSINYAASGLPPGLSLVQTT